MKQLRYAFRLMWRGAPREMKRYDIPVEGSFDVHNGHAGKCWGWPKECSLTDTQARGIYNACYNSKKLTLPMMIVVRKGMAYAWELTGHQPGGNFPGVKEVWGIVRQCELPGNTMTTIPDRIPLPEDLRKAFTKSWDPEGDWSLIEYCQGNVAAYHWAVFGLRSREDIARVKKAPDHFFDWKAGWQCSEFAGGRAKLCGRKKGTRKWRAWMVCHCKGGEHQRPPADFCEEIDMEGNPDDPEKVEWCTECPLACLELMWQCQHQAGVPQRCYAKWNEGSGNFGKKNVNDVVALAIDWLEFQGACTEDNRYNSNAGRKSLGKWTRRLNVPYEESFQLHGDLWEVWHKSYEQAVPKSKYEVRTQSTDPDTACVALRKFANWLGRGGKVRPKLSPEMRVQYALLKAMKGSKYARAVANGLAGDSDDEED